jgi:hypothetical protein
VLNRKVALAVAFALATEVTSGPIRAQSSAVTSSKITFNIPAQPLNTALRAFSAATGVQLVYNSELAAGHDSDGVSGSYAPSEALRKLLDKSGLTFHFVNDSTVMIEKPPDTGGPRVLGPLQVEGAEGANALAGANGSSDPTATQGTGSLHQIQTRVSRAE